MGELIARIEVILANNQQRGPPELTEPRVGIPALLVFWVVVFVGRGVFCCVSVLEFYSVDFFFTTKSRRKTSKTQLV